jgi:S-adenosylmethionine synthetase
MALKNFIFTSESVSEGHPDKVCDQVSDAILDAILERDKRGRVACETLVKNNALILAGEVTTDAKINYEKIARDTIRDIGYTEAELGFDADTFAYHSFLSEQSQDISMGVNEGEGTFKEQGAGDQGLMFGFACDETKELMPLPILLAHQLVECGARKRKSGKANFLKPDAKSQVTVRYENGEPKAIDTVVFSTQHSKNISLKEVQEFVIEEIVKEVIPANYLDSNTKFLINPTGRFVIGGPVGDCGLTGRKIIVDTYGGYGRHGGGAFSGKDPSKVDRSAAYVARYIAKNIVAANAASRCEVQLAYAIGYPEPVSVLIDTFGTGKFPESKIAVAVLEVFNLTPRGITESLGLLKPIYRESASYGHFGRTPGNNGSFSWERTDKVDVLKRALGC